MMNVKFRFVKMPNNIFLSPLDEASLDFEVLPDRLTNPNRVNVLLVATRIENVEARSEVLQIANLNPKLQMSKVLH